MKTIAALLPGSIFENGKTVHLGDLWAAAEDFGSVSLDDGYSGYRAKIYMKLPGGTFWAEGNHRRAEEALAAAITSAHNATIALGG